jgi:3-dehydroquinate synthase
VSVIRVQLPAAPARCYDVRCGSGILTGIGSALAAAGARQAVVVCDAAVESTHAASVVDSIAAAGIGHQRLTVASGERSKSVSGLARLWDAFALGGVDRATHVVAVGGGVVGDLAGFAAATYARGLAFWQVPTTVVAQVDSSVGGKTGINLDAGKNLVGAFWQPCGVFCDIDTLGSLPKREFVSGLAEVVKYGMILDSEFFAWLETQAPAVLRRDPGSLAQMVERSVQIKARVVEHDERETSGKRAALNYGHTFGHAYETAAGYGRLLHGEAVAIGMSRAVRLAEALGRVARDLVVRQDRLLERLELPTAPPSDLVSGLGDATAVARRLLEIMARDKKAVGGQVRFVLPDRIGRVELVSGVDEQQVLQALVD